MTTAKTSKSGRTGYIIVDTEKCKACGLCISYCPQHNLGSAHETNTRGFHPVCMMDEDECTGCGICALVCPDACIRVYRR